MIQIIMTLSAPIFFILFENKLKIIKWLSPVVCSYLTGILMSQFFLANNQLSHQIAEVVVPLSLPLLLLPTDIIKWFKLAKSTILSFFFVMFSVVVGSVVGFLMFKNILPQASILAGMIVAVFIGGTANLTAVGLAMGVDENSYLILNASEMLVGGVYLLMVLTILPKMYAKLLRPFISVKEDFEHTTEHLLFESFDWKRKFKHLILLLLVSITILGTFVGLSKFLFGKMDILFIILSISSIGIILSFKDKYRHTPGAFELGNYLLLVFCVSIGSLVKISDLLNGSLDFIYFVSIILIVSVLLHLILCYIFKIDRDTAIITSVAGIFGPPFIGPVTQILKNKEMMMSGVSTGIVGIALGTYAGILFIKLIQILLPT
jgi:uncharacterized membrane protein